MSLPARTHDNADATGPRRMNAQKSRKVRTLLLGVSAFVLVSALIAGSYLFNLAQTFDANSEEIESAFPEESTRPQKVLPSSGARAPINILVLGSDSRGAAELDAVNGLATDQRADTVMLVHIPAERRNIYAISIMRDLWVQIPGRQEAKINAALAMGGVPLIVQTVESMFNQRLDHVAMVDFEGFKGLTDALGGVEVVVDAPFTATHGGHKFSAGANTMNGEAALGFVRERYSFADGDYQRVRNQQSFMKAVIAKTANAQTLSNPSTISKAVSALSPFISVDNGVNSSMLAGLGLELNGVRQQDIAMFTLPTLGTGTSPDGQSIVIKDEKAVSDISAALGAGRLDEYIASNQLLEGN